MYDVPLFRAIAEHVLAPASNRPTIVLTKLKFVNLRLKDQDGNFRHVEFGRKTQLWELMCAHQNLTMYQTAFYYNGSELEDTETPEMLEMLDNDVISTGICL